MSFQKCEFSYIYFEKRDFKNPPYIGTALVEAAHVLEHRGRHDLSPEIIDFRGDKYFDK